MSVDSARALLMRTLLARYQEFRERLTRRFDSPELAADAMQETWLRLRRPGALAPVRHPGAYLYRTALNTGLNLRQAQARHLSAAEIDDLLDLADDAPGPATIAAGRAEWAQLEAALAELTARQQDVFRASFLRDVPHGDLAARYGVSVRTIQIELKRAIDHCGQRLGRGRSFANEAPGLSNEQEQPS